MTDKIIELPESFLDDLDRLYEEIKDVKIKSKMTSADVKKLTQHREKFQALLIELFSWMEKDAVSKNIDAMIMDRNIKDMIQTLRTL